MRYGGRPLPAPHGARYTVGYVTDSPLSAGELRAAAETHKELPTEYRDAVLESFVERVGREIDARVDARLAQAASRPAATQPTPPPPAPRPPKPVSAMVLALGSIALGIPLSAIAVGVGTNPAGFAGLLVIWIAIAVINLGYASKMRPPGDQKSPRAPSSAGRARTGRGQNSVPASHQASVHVLDREGVTEMVPPGAVDVQVPAAQPLLMEAELFHHAPAGVIFRADARLDPVQPHDKETMVDRHRQRRGNDFAAGRPFVDPVPHLPGPGRAPQDAADRQLASEPPVVNDGPGQRLALPRLAPHGARHGHVRADAGPVQRRFRIGRLPGPQPVGVAHPGFAPHPRVPDPDRAQHDGTVQQRRFKQRYRPPAHASHGDIIPLV